MNPMPRPLITYFVFTHGMTDAEHDALCDKQTTLVAKHIVRTQRGTAKMTVQQAETWLRTHAPNDSADGLSRSQT